MNNIECKSLFAPNDYPNLDGPPPVGQTVQNTTGALVDAKNAYDGTKVKYNVYVNPSDKGKVLYHPKGATIIMPVTGGGASQQLSDTTTLILNVWTKSQANIIGF